MTVYRNNNKDEKSIFASVDFDDANSLAYFFVKSEVDVDRAKESLANAGQQIIAQSYVKGHTVVITQGQTSKEELFNRISTEKDDKFEPVQKEKKTTLQFIKDNGWKLRGGSSIVGQTMTLAAAATTVSKADALAGKLTPRFDPAKGFFAIFNLAANFTNFIFGGQKEEDVKGLEKFDGIIADEVNRYLPEGEKKISPDDVRKLSYMNDKELEEHNKDRSATGIMKRNSVRIGEVGLRTVGSIALMFGPLMQVAIRPWKWKSGFGEMFKGGVKQSFNAAKTKDPFTYWAGVAYVAGKIMGLTAKTEDPNNPPTTYWEEIRQKVLWRVSSFTEMVAQGAMVYDEHNSKKLVLGGKAHYNSLGVVGNTLLTVPPYPARLVLPYGQKVLDTDEGQARLLDELHKLPQDKIPEVAARVTARMVEHMGENSPSFSELYSKLLGKLNKYHGVAVLPFQPENSAVNATPEAEEKTISEASNWANKLAAAPKIPDDAKNPDEKLLDYESKARKHSDKIKSKDKLSTDLSDNSSLALSR
jgi:hypothetical protein